LYYLVKLFLLGIERFRSRARLGFIARCIFFASAIVRTTFTLLNGKSNSI
jgi:hypothetical protein